MAEHGNDEGESGNADRPLNGSAHEHEQYTSDSSSENAVDGTGAGQPDSDDPSMGLDNLSAMQGDEALLNALGGLALPSEESSVDDDELNELLLAWRRDIDSEPMAELVNTDTAVTTIKTAAAARRHSGMGSKRRALVPVAVAAAVLAIAFTGSGLAARNAEPGDALWGLTQVLYTDHAQSVQAAASVRTDLEAAGLAIDNGRVYKARDALDSAAQALESVSPEDNLNKLRTEHRLLSHQLDKPPEEGTSSTSGTSLPGESSSGTSSTSSPDSSSSAEPSDSQLPPEQSSPSDEPDPSTPSTTSSSPTTTPTASSSDGRSDSDTPPNDGLPHIETQGAPAS